MVNICTVRWSRLLVCMLLFFSGCAGLGKPVEEPQVTLVDLQVMEVKALEAIFQLELRVINPNDFPLDLRGVSCELKIDGKHFATGLGAEPQEIAAFGTGIVPVRVYASTLKMFASVLQLIQGMGHQQHQQAGMEPIRYELAGTIRLGGTLNRSVPFHSSGELPLDVQTP